MRICMVCLGNICRSPAAEAVLVSMLAEAGLGDVEVDSAGTADYHVGEPAHPDTVAEGERRGYAVRHRGRQLLAGDLAAYDLVLAMDASNLADLHELRAGDDGDGPALALLGAFTADGPPAEVPDPWGQGPEAFAAMYDQLERACQGLVQRLRDGTVAEVAPA